MGKEQGDVKVEEGVFSVTLIFEDMKVQLDAEDVIDLYFIEDIFKNSMTGKLVFYDKYNFLELGPFTGNEQILITYGKVTDVTLIFDIWKVSEISMTKTANSQSFGMIEVFFVDPGFQQMTLRKYSKSWEAGTTTEDIMIHILDNMTTLTEESKLEYERSNTQMSKGFIMPYWTPQQALSFLMRRTIGNDSGNSGFLCFNNTYDRKLTTNLCTLDYLLNNFGKNADPDTYMFTDRDISAENKILEWSISGTDKLAHGFLRGGRFMGYDWDSKTLHNNIQTYSNFIDGDDVRAMTILGNKTLFPNISDEHSVVMNIGEDDVDILNNIFYSEWSQRYILQNVINVTLFGHEKRFAGQLIDIKWPSSVEAGSDGNFSGFNLSYKGTYMIKSITHSFVGSQSQQEPYLQKAVLIKNGYSNVDTNAVEDSSRTYTLKGSHSVIGS